MHFLCGLSIRFFYQTTLALPYKWTVAKLSFEKAFINDFLFEIHIKSVILAKTCTFWLAFLIIISKLTIGMGP